MNEEKTFEYFLEKAKAIFERRKEVGENLRAIDLALFGSYFYSVGYDDCREDFTRRGL